MCPVLANEELSVAHALEVLALEGVHCEVGAPSVATWLQSCRANPRVHVRQVDEARAGPAGS